MGVTKRPRVIMRSFYVIESQRSAEQDWLLAGAARRPVHDTRHILGFDHPGRTPAHLPPLDDAEPDHT
jgi:hypothetical protein